MSASRWLCAVALAGLWSGCSCGDDSSGEGEGEGDGGGWLDDDGGVIQVRDGGIIIETDAGPVVCYRTICDGHELECGNCEDDDGDGHVDWMDPECLGPCDNTEGPALSAGIGGEAGGPCKADCYFDFGNGSGNDQCEWDHRCDPLAVGPDFPPEGPNCAYDEDRVGTRDCPASQSDTCLDFCPRLTPNGCDCFGCCTFPELEGHGPAGGAGFVWIGHLDDDNAGTCTFDDILDPDRCPPCTPVADCFNDCGRCEVCLGRPEPPADCFEPAGPDAGPGDLRCELGIQTCGLPGDQPCPADFYCITGCCQAILF